jgi:transcriptional regulator GlxA family with amidase domain
MSVRHVGVYVFDDVEVLDFAGPFEVFSTASRVFHRLNPDSVPPFDVFTVGVSRIQIRTRGGLLVEPHFSFAEHPMIDVLLIPGGVVTAELDAPSVISWIATQARSAQLTASVCTGAFLIGKAGLLGGKRATTHWEDVADLRRLLPDTRVLEETRWVDEGTVVTSAGISAGLDMSLHIVARLAGKELAVRTARQMEYEWRDDP